jgi:Raf kinase inhibitor-like YbhB/YbcL family protein
MSQSKSFRPSLESLEGREVPATLGYGFTLSPDRVLSVTGFGGGLQYASSVRYNDAGQVVVSRGGTSRAVLEPAEVTKIVYQGGSAAESFTNHTRIPSEFSGMGAGDRYETPFKLEGPSRLPNSSASGQTAVNGVRIGSNIPPHLTWKEPPHGTASFTLTMIDIDAEGYPGGYTHMVLNNILASARSLDQALADGATYGVNGRGRYEYYGPNPPNTETHRYVFTLTALDANGNVLGTTQFTSTFAYPHGTQTDTGWNP